MGGNRVSKDARIAAFSHSKLLPCVLPDSKVAKMSGPHPAGSRLPAPAGKKFPGCARSNIPNPFRRRPEPVKRSPKEQASSKVQQAKTATEPKETKVFNGEPQSAWKSFGRIEHGGTADFRSPGTGESAMEIPRSQAALDRNANRDQPLNYGRQISKDALNGNQPDVVATVVANERVVRNGTARLQQVKFGYQSQLQQPRKAEITRMPVPGSKLAFQTPAGVSSPAGNGVVYSSNFSARVPNIATKSTARPSIPKVPGIARASPKFVQESKPSYCLEAKPTSIRSVEKKPEPPTFRRFENTPARRALWSEHIGGFGDGQPVVFQDAVGLPLKPSMSDGRIGPKADAPSGVPTKGVLNSAGTTEKSSSWDYHYRLRGPTYVPVDGPGSASLSNLKPPAVSKEVESHPTTWKYVTKKQLVSSKSAEVRNSPKDVLGHGATRLEAVMDPVTKSFKLKPVSIHVKKNEVVQQSSQALKPPVRRPLDKSWFSQQQRQQFGGGSVSVSSCSVVTSSCDEESIDNDPKDELSLQFERNLENAFEIEQCKPVPAPQKDPPNVEEHREATSRLSDNHEEYEPKSSTSSGREDSDSTSPRSSGQMGPSSGFLIDDEIVDQPDLLSNSNDLTLSPCSNNGITSSTELFGYTLGPLHSSNTVRAVQESVEVPDEDDDGNLSRPNSLELRSVSDEETIHNLSCVDCSTPEKSMSRMVSGQGSPSSGSLPTPGKSALCSSTPIMNRTIPFAGQSSSPSRIIFKPPKPMSASDEDPSCVRVEMSMINHMSQDVTYLKTKLLGLRRILDQSDTVNPFDDSPQGSVYWYNLMHNMGTSDGLSPCRTPTTPDASQMSPFNSGRALPPPPCGDSGDMKALQEENLRLKRQLADLSRQSKFQKQQLEEKDKAIRHLNCQLAANAVMYGKKKPEEESPPVKLNSATQTERPRNVSLERMGNIGPYISSSPPCIPGALGIPRMSGIRSPSRGRSRSQNRV